MELDFKWMDRLAQGSMTEEGAAQKDKLLSQGYSISSEPTPFDAGGAQMPQEEAQRLHSSPQEQGCTNIPATQPKQSHASLRPMSSIAGVNYRTLYRQACNFHERSMAADRANPDGYWVSIAQDYGETISRNNGNLFLLDLLEAIMRELEREWKAVEPPA